MNLFPLFFALASLQSISGVWFGKGRIEDLGGKWASECEVAFRISAGADQLLLEEGQYACEGFGMEWQPLTFSVANARLGFEGNDVGSIRSAIGSEGFEFRLRGGDGTYWDASFAVDGDEAAWKDVMGEPGDGIRSEFLLRRFND